MNEPENYHSLIFILGLLLGFIGTSIGALVLFLLGDED